MPALSSLVTMTHPTHLTDTALTTELGRLAGREREATAALIVHLAEFDARRLYEGAGYSSVFQYCRAVLLLSEDAAYNRIQTARAARRHPAIVDMLVGGTLSPTTARLIARRLTSENHRELLAAASGKGKQAVEELLARWFPQADVAPRVRALPHRPVSIATLDPPVSHVAVAPAGGDPVPPVVARDGQFPSRTAVDPRPVVRPLAPERYEIRFTASADTRERLRRAQDLLGHAIPSGDIAQVIDRALILLVADLERRKFAATPRPRPTAGQSEDSRNIPAEVRRGAVARDEGRCAFVAPNGRRCGERRFLEFHHVIPYGAGGKPSIENIQLRCRAHNGYEARRFYGRPAQHPGLDAAETPTRAGTSSPKKGGTIVPGLSP